MAFSLSRVLVTSVCVLLCASLQACDSRDTAPPVQQTAPPPSGISPFDGQPIQAVGATDLDEYARTVRAAIASRGLSMPASATAGDDESVRLSQALGAGARDTQPLSTHIALTVGERAHQYVLMVDAENIVASLHSDDRYVLMDPDVFSPDENDQPTARDVPATNLATGEETMVHISESGTTKDGESVDVLVVDAVSVYDPADEKDPLSGMFGDASAPREAYGESNLNGVINVVALGLHSLRVDQNFDIDGNVSTKQETQFTWQATDDYGVQFQRYNTARFDKALWTAGTRPGVSLPTTLQPVYSSGSGAFHYSLWYFATDVNYANTDYSFEWDRYYRCLGNMPCTTLEVDTDFPLILFQSAHANLHHRVYLNEDDHLPSSFSRRSGDWTGQINTVNFASGAIQATSTRVDANNHAIVTDDAIFNRGGVRRINVPTLQQATGNGAVRYTLNNGGLRWEFSQMTVSI